MTRVVLDTNVVVSAHIQPAGVPARILLLAFAKEFELYVSSAIVAEYDDVLDKSIRVSECRNWISSGDFKELRC